jgi:dihydrodipicolinate synthase/N-acetylneuraminate lyase
MQVRGRLAEGLVIPAHPLALNSDRKFDERRQRALTRYYAASGVGGIAVGVHTTQFAIREAGLLRPVLQLARETIGQTSVLSIAGVCGITSQAIREAELAAELHYDAALLSLAALPNATTRKLIEHTAAVAEIIPIIGFYLQPSVGGRALSYEFWRRFMEVPNVVAIKIAPFNRYATIDVVRALADSGRSHEIALYTGNDDNIVADLLTPFRINGCDIRIQGGLLGHWAVWTHRVVELFKNLAQMDARDALALGAQITDCNAAFFDAANGFRGCIAGLHEILRRQGLLEGRWCLNPQEDISPGQLEEIDRVYSAYPHLNDDDFVREHLDQWLR